ncbi:adenosylcobinamide-phosphate synthase CbiB [Dinoroseobacter sp. S375]|uniref:adenosylcobinamide-phosphate synthase CbiB n=1 Tax=Dinoroseobacter sp. S375 TaxID=3415136 RepID=UPI003C7D685C
MTEHAAILLVALLLDAAFGEPDWLWSRLPHPAVLMGRLIGGADARLNTGKDGRFRGVLVMVTLGLCAVALGAALASLGWVVEALLAAILLAHRSLVEHVRAVATGLQAGLPQGRAAVAMIVGRDTAALDAPGVARAAIESGAENFSDGVLAPAFWFLTGGLPGLMLYKITNTADSMIGYRTPRHEAFGWAAARFDDLLNWVPARLSALVILVAAGRPQDWPLIARDAPLHRSPNAGWPEAAMAVALGTALAGPRSYDGAMREFPFVHPEGSRTPGPDTIEGACRALWRAWGLTLALVAILAVV